MQHAASLKDKAAGTHQMCTVRQSVVKQLALERECLESLPESAQYQRAARWYLKRRRSAVSSRKDHKALMLDHLQTQLDVDGDVVKEVVGTPCNRHGKPHDCMSPFAAQPDALRNWRVLWRRSAFIWY